nr:MAG TPA: hypothetical protein [Caudoviricetes sp.]
MYKHLQLKNKIIKIIPFGVLFFFCHINTFKTAF